MVMMATAERESRVAVSGKVVYRHSDPEEQGVAQWCNVSRAGAGITLGRYLRPGREIVLELEDAMVRGRIVWCAARRGCGYSAGLSILRDTPESALAFTRFRERARGHGPALWKLPAAV